MSFQYLLESIFQGFQPKALEVLHRTKRDITLSWDSGPFGFISDHLLYKVEKREKVPAWVVVYSGGKTTRTIEYLPPSHPHKFRLKIILKSSGVQLLETRARNYFGDEETALKEIYQAIRNEQDNKIDYELNEKVALKVKEFKSSNEINERYKDWLESKFSEETWTSTDSDGTSAICFGMAVRCGYIKQLQVMLEERPALIGIINANNGFTPLAVAVRRGHLNTVRFLLSAGAEIDQTCSTGQTPLHLAVFFKYLNIVELLLEKGGNFDLPDKNGLRVEHYAVDSQDLEMLRFILDRGDVEVRDNNGWTPLFRAVCQGASTMIIAELVQRGSDLMARDNAGLALTSAARCLKDRHGRNRESILRLVDVSFPHEKAVENFTRITKKINRVHSLFR